MQRLHVRQANAHGVHKLLAERKRVLQKTHQHATDSVRLAHGAWRHRLPAAASTCPFDRMSLKTRRNDFFRPRRRRRPCDDSRYYIRHTGQRSAQDEGSTPKSDQHVEGTGGRVCTSWLYLAAAAGTAEENTAPGVPACRGRLRFLTTLTNGRSAAAGNPTFGICAVIKTTPGCRSGHAGTPWRPPRELLGHKLEHKK